jgi:hypothetical protein
MSMVTSSHSMATSGMSLRAGPILQMISSFSFLVDMRRTLSSPLLRRKSPTAFPPPDLLQKDFRRPSASRFTSLRAPSPILSPSSDAGISRCRSLCAPGPSPRGRFQKPPIPIFFFTGGSGVFLPRRFYQLRII